MDLVGWTVNIEQMDLCRKTKNNIIDFTLLVFCYFYSVDKMDLVGWMVNIERIDLCRKTKK